MIKSEVLEFQKDLQSGMTIDDALKKHNLSLLEVWENIHYKRRKPVQPKRKRPNHSTGEQYIQLNQNGYLLRKNNRYYGRYDTLKDAVTVRDYLIKHGWSKENWHKIRGTL